MSDTFRLPSYQLDRRSATIKLCATRSSALDQGAVVSAIYDKLGIRFMYPENWEIAEDDPRDEPRTVTAQNDSGAFWSITSYGQPVDPTDLAATALSALREEYEELEAEYVSETIGQTEATGYEIHFYVQQLVAAARIRVFQHDAKMVLLLCQAEDREFDQLEPVFRAMTHSLLQVAPPQP